MFPALAEAVEELEVPVDGRSIAAALRLRDRLEAKIVEALGPFDAAELWDLDAATSLTAWLRSQADQSHKAAGRLARTATRLRALPVLSSAFSAGDVSSGQVDAVMGMVEERHLELFAEHEAELVPTLVGLPVPVTVQVLRAWVGRAEALVDQPEEAEPVRSLHASTTLGGRVELSGSLDADSGQVLTTALRMATTTDVEGEASRTPAERRADALADICRYYLDTQCSVRGGRHRPHLNVVVDLADLEAGAGGRYVDGTPLSGTSVSTLLCDSALHRLITKNRSTILDYGVSTRTIPAPLWNALVLRDLICRFPGCDRPAQWGEGHHVVWVEWGGETKLGNLVLLCSRHHHRLHRPGWQAKLHPDGVFEVTAPDGRHWVTHPPGVGGRLC